MILMIDNYDSFTYNLVQYLKELGCDVNTTRNDKLTLDRISSLAPDRIVISPGPCTPDKAGISLDVVRKFGERVPILGVCLGHQVIGQAFGGRITHAKKIMHGKTSMIHHQGDGLFGGFANPFQATRYHSLVIEQKTLPDCFKVTAWTGSEMGEVDEIMAVRHKEYPIAGVQFHPESILTDHGHELLEHFIHDEF